ncbi:SDR family oxidoreductase [Amycolatopsis sp. NPDC051903]|uniref:SDR family oxidoreductase n=1 Tax=Amycolatopsis sp. NPDC051903 TaxID=3363936 RepID=UPI0037B6173A
MIELLGRHVLGRNPAHDAGVVHQDVQFGVARALLQAVLELQEELVPAPCSPSSAWTAKARPPSRSIDATVSRAASLSLQRALSLLPDGGRIVNISSGLTRFANPDEVAYAMTKGAVEQITLHFAKHLGPRGITVNSVAPGITNNGPAIFDNPDVVAQLAKLSVFDRVGDATDVADIVAFLVGEDARWITGSFVDASGGTLLK